ncbi:hypothetical protein [Sneathiella limimaris]|uniref:hypothetical protein n=1 Tax=Sneathiella limimaris TaxID=1964213 RepID=UPI00146E7D51|nr:hypothetical protein [Sneathiella limimaris]
MRQISADKTGFASLTIVELLLQELILKDILDDRDVKRLLKAAAKRHEKSANGSPDKIELNMETATLIRLLLEGLQPALKKAKKKRKSMEKVALNQTSA